jgi:PIN domain nuclease of toxin-antitoxin system
MMRLLLDTHIWLWSFREPHKLSSQVHKALHDPRNARFLSPVSIWEVMILVEKKRIAMQEDFAIWTDRSIKDLELDEAALSWAVVRQMRYILPNHRDPADRFLAATAIAYDLALVTADQKLLSVPGLKVLVNA